MSVILEKFYHYEFWPGWIFYLPLMPYLFFKSLRGASVRILHSPQEMHRYIENTPGSVLIQDYHSGPEEVGIFYTILGTAQ
jgi:hypothetical protein